MNAEDVSIEGAVCPVPLPHRQRIVLGHGSGGRLSQDLITRLFLPPFANPVLNAGDDAGVVQFKNDLHLAISTDSHVVWPLFFPGGDIGRLAVCGTVNDVAMMGAVPLFLTAGFILEEGLDVQVLEQVVHSMQLASAEAGVQLIAGDTKVVQKGKADSLYINTTGIGLLSEGVSIGGSGAQPGDKVLLSGPIGDHGIAVLSARGDLGFEADLESDVAPLNHLVMAILRAAQVRRLISDVHVLRDPTRGGLATTLNEIARQSSAAILIHEDHIPVRPVVAAACELLGFDPLYIANEGKLVAIVAPEIAGQVLDTMRQTRYGEEAIEIGEVLASPAGRVLMKTSIGSTRVVDTLAGELLPRIC
jgi:hydrogenase expression/formation protein HypE